MKFSCVVQETEMVHLQPEVFGSSAGGEVVERENLTEKLGGEKKRLFLIICFLLSQKSALRFCHY